MSSGDDGLPLTIEFGGGAELLFGKKKKHEVNLPGGEEWTLKRLLYWIRDNLLTEREELFLQDDTVRPGILVLVNDADWELLATPFVVQYGKADRIDESNQQDFIASQWPLVEDNIECLPLPSYTSSRSQCVGCTVDLTNWKKIRGSRVRAKNGTSV